MDLLMVLKAVAALSVIGLIASSVLASAARKFRVEVDPRVEQVARALPGSNCGACGNPSCFVVAERMVAGELPVSACLAGGQSVADECATALGADVCEMAAVVSVRACGGGSGAARTFEYAGVSSCAAAHRLAGGPLGCQWGCVGFGDCVQACPFGAMSIDDRDLPRIDPAKCTGCGICVHECPRGGTGLLSLVTDEAPVVVRCGAHDKPKSRKANCPSCCIACKKCERECPEDAVHVIDMIAVVDYEKCSGCLMCVVVCPAGCIDVHGRGAKSDPLGSDGKGPKVLENEPVSVVADEG